MAVEGASFTDGVDNIVGTDAAEIFVIPSEATINTGDQLDGGAGIDTLQLSSSSLGMKSYELFKLTKLSGVENILGSEQSEGIQIKAAQLNDVLTLDGGEGSDELILWGGESIDLTGKTVTGFETIKLSSDVNQVTVDNRATAQLIDGRTSQNDHLILTSDDLTDAEREAYFLRGIDTITDKSGRTTSNLAPQLAGLDGDQVQASVGNSVLLDVGSNVTLGAEDNDLYYLQFYATGDAYGDLNFNLEIQVGNGIELSHKMEHGSQVSVDGVVIGMITNWSGQWLLDIEFNTDATPVLVQKLIQSVAYRNSSLDGNSIIHHEVGFYIEDLGGRYSEATIDVTIAPDTYYFLTPDVDTFLGTDANETFVGGSLSISDADAINGGGGIDTLRIEAGIIDLRRPALLSNIEILRGSTGDDIVLTNAERLAGFTGIQGGSGHDELHLAAGDYDLRGKIIAGVEVISVQDHGSLTFDDKGTALLSRTVPDKAVTVTLQGDAFTEAELALLFRQGIKTIKDTGGTHTNAAPDDISLNGASVKELAGYGTVVGVLSADDPNPGDTVKYTLVDDAGGRFKIGADGKSIVVANGSLLDYEQARSHTVTVRAVDQDGAGLSFGKSFTISVDDVATENVYGSSGHDKFHGGSGHDILRGADGFDKLYGNSGNDTLSGGAGNDKLFGGWGNDRLSGGTGKDYFVFTTPLSSRSNVDTIVDFTVADDTIFLENAIFTKLGAGTSAAPKAIASAWFRLGTVAQDANDYILYDRATGLLRYDADGSGAGAAIAFAKVTPGTALTVYDLMVI
jgi:Ca2+-binding RTX toxin-like protein